MRYKIKKQEKKFKPIEINILIETQDDFDNFFRGVGKMWTDGGFSSLYDTLKELGARKPE